LGGFGSGEGLGSRGPGHVDDNDVGYEVARPRVGVKYGMEVVRWRMRGEKDDDTGRRKTEESERSDEREDKTGQDKKGDFLRTHKHKRIRPKKGQGSVRT
jgi:hypothetical protein